MTSPGRRWRRKDVTTSMLLHAIDKWGVNALDVLQEVHQIPTKVLVAAVHRDTPKRLINWGISPWRPFLDVEGQRVVREAKVVRRVNSQGGRGRALSERRPDNRREPVLMDLRMVEVTAELISTPDGPPEVQRASGTPDVVAAWLRALADRLDPPRPVTRVRDVDPEQHRRGRGFNVLPPATH